MTTTPGLVSILIPARSEQFLVKTVNDLLTKASGDVEVIVILDGGQWPTDDELPYDRIKVIRHAESIGMRSSLNEAIQVATGEFVMKTDAHCMFERGFDEVLRASCFPSTVVVPRRKRLDPIAWAPEPFDGRPDVDYTYQSWHPTYFANWRMGWNGKPWDEKNRDESLRDILIDETLTMQGSCYFLRRDYWDELELLDDVNYDQVGNEAEEISFKAWLSGGRVIVDKRTSYSHLHKGRRYPRDYERNKRAIDRSARFTRRWLQGVGLAWHKQTLPFSWLVEKFNPPGWDGWQDVVKEWK